MLIHVCNIYIYAVLVPVQLVMVPQSKIVNEWNPVLLRCQASGYPVPTITWTKDGRRLLGAQRDVNIAQSRKSDAGRYVCTADNGVGPPKAAEAYVTVQCKYKHVIDWQCNHGHVKRQMAFLGMPHC